MPPSMRKQARLENARRERDNAEAKRRVIAFEALRDAKTVAEAVNKSGISRTTGDRINAALKKQDDAALSRLLNPESNRAGRRRVISDEESEMIKHRLTFSASRGFAFDASTLKKTMADIASDGRQGFHFDTGLPSDAAIRHWRACNRDITFRVAENKRAASLIAERFDHVVKFRDALQSVKNEHPDIFTDAERLWNIDETPVSAEYGRKIKVFTSSDSHHGGTRAQRNGKAGKHVTAVVAVSASGRKAPPFFIVSGKNVMNSWLRPLEKEQVGSDKKLQWLSTPGWLPKDAVILMTENGSMEIRVIHHIIQHVNKFVRQFVPPEKAFCLTIDGHSSRLGSGWLEISKSVGCEVIQSPSDTSHFLQPCNQWVNKAFKKAMREGRDALIAQSFIDLSSVRANLMVGVIGFYAISPSCIFRSFSECGLWPMDFRFLNRFEKEHAAKQERQSREADAERIRANTRVKSVMTRKTDTEIWSVIQKATSSKVTPSKGLQIVEQHLANHKSVNKILMEVSDPRRNDIEKNRKSRDKNFALYKGTPAACLTLGDMLEQRQRDEAAAKAEQARKEQIKALKREEREKKRIEKKRQSEMRLAKRIERKAAKTQGTVGSFARKRRPEQRMTNLRHPNKGCEEDAVSGLQQLSEGL